MSEMFLQYPLRDQAVDELDIVKGEGLPGLGESNEEIGFAYICVKILLPEVVNEGLEDEAPIPGAKMADVMVALVIEERELDRSLVSLFVNSVGDDVVDGELATLPLVLVPVIDAPLSLRLGLRIGDVPIVGPDETAEEGDKVDKVKVRRMVRRFLIEALLLCLPTLH
ncbi:hypothetical protein BDZ45DRAFT_760870 [Acephala macrosclerotiorum]|nr:hypothetical protein BDZ45DRAFT_760870 [Acephala macrosclerotiorum]